MPKDDADLPIHHMDSSTKLVKSVKSPTQASNSISGQTIYLCLIEDCALTIIVCCEVGNCFLSLSAIDKAGLMEPRKPLFVN
jgi:hypothetical protein